MTPENTHVEANGHEKMKEITVIVNARPKITNEKALNFEEIVILAFDTYDSNPDVIYVITYSDKHGNSSHEVSVGQSVKAKEGMIFNVTPTNRS